MADNAPIKPAVFTWNTGVNENLYEYTQDNKSGAFKAHGTTFHRPMIANEVLSANTGKHYWEMAVNSDNLRVGVCTADCDTDSEMGTGRGLYSLNLQNGNCEIEGKQLKQLWRIMMPGSGGRVGLCWDSDNGTLQAWLNHEYLGAMIHEAFAMKGKDVRPCAGIAGIETNNRIIGVGMKAAVFQDSVTLPKPVL
jgi:hypothetical protein